MCVCVCASVCACVNGTPKRRKLTGWGGVGWAVRKKGVCVCVCVCVYQLEVTFHSERIKYSDPRTERAKKKGSFPKV